MSQNYEKRLLRVLQYIHDQPAADMSLDRLADVAAMSRFHWHRVFRAMTGETCAQAVRRVRLHRAATLLLETQTDPARIARQVGYDSTRSFARAFAAQYGQSPTAFRAGRVHTAPLLIRQWSAAGSLPITIRTEPPKRMVGLSHRGKYAHIGQSFESFFAICRSRNLWPQMGPPMGVSFDSPENTAEDELRGFAGALFRGQEVPEGLATYDVAGGRYAVAAYTGPYAGLSKAYDVVFGQWLPASDEMPADAPCVEVYVKSPTNTAPENLVTEILLPLKGHNDDG